MSVFESCRSSKQARYQLSHPSPFDTLSLCFLFTVTIKQIKKRTDALFSGFFFSLESYEAPRENLYSEKTLTLSCLGSTVAALVAGCLLGFLASRRYTQRHSYLKCGHAYLEAQSKLDR